MDEINIRFKQIRELCGKSQEEWGKSIGISRSGVSEIESGRRNVTEKHLKLLEVYQEKPINVEWLRTGEGEPFLEITRNEAITDFMSDILNEDNTFKNRLIAALAKLDESQWKVLEQIAEESIKKD